MCCQQVLGSLLSSLDPFLLRTMVFPLWLHAILPSVTSLQNKPGILESNTYLWQSSTPFSFLGHSVMVWVILNKAHSVFLSESYKPKMQSLVHFHEAILIWSIKKLEEFSNSCSFPVCTFHGHMSDDKRATNSPPGSWTRPLPNGWFPPLHSSMALINPWSMLFPLPYLRRMSIIAEWKWRRWLPSGMSENWHFKSNGWQSVLLITCEYTSLQYLWRSSPPTCCWGSWDAFPSLTHCVEWVLCSS